MSSTLRMYLLIGALSVLLPTAALAQDQHTEAATDEAPEEDETAWALTAGGVWNTGNTRSWQVGAGTALRLVRGIHQFELTGDFAYGQAAPADDPSADLEDTMRNLNARARYDIFFTDNDAVFVAEQYRWDTFAGLDTRLQTQLGYLRNFLSEEKHRFWSEVGYDYTYDNLHPDPLIDPVTGLVLAGTANVHSARVFLGYDNQLNDYAVLLLGLEALFNIEDGEDVRLAADAAFRSTIAERLQLEFKFSLKFDNQPVPGAEEVDTTTRVNIIYTLI